MKKLSLILIGSGVIAGAFGAHLLKNFLSDNYLEIYKTAVFYQITMSIVLLVLSKELFPSKKTKLISLLSLTIGIIIFSGSLYLLVLLNLPFLGAITPIGGTLIIFSILYSVFILNDT